MRGLEIVESYSERTCSYVLSKVFENVLRNSLFLNEIAINLRPFLNNFSKNKAFYKHFSSTFRWYLKGTLMQI